jgi:hypothetical protein
MKGEVKEEIGKRNVVSLSVGSNPHIYCSNKT